MEDDSRLRKLTANRLESLGYEVFQAPSGKQAVELFDRLPPIDLLLTDVVMPEGLSGFDLARAARERRPDLAVLLVSGYAGIISDDGTPVSRAVFLKKPFTKRELSVAVLEALNG